MPDAGAAAPPPPCPPCRPNRRTPAAPPTPCRPQPQHKGGPAGPLSGLAAKLNGAAVGGGAPAAAAAWLGSGDDGPPACRFPELVEKVRMGHVDGDVHV